MDLIYKSTALLFSLYWTTIEAQPLLTSDVSPNIGVETIYYEYNAGDFSPGPTGANVTWDFSSLAQGSKVSYSYVDPSTIPGYSNYPDANVCAVGGGQYRVFIKKSNSVDKHYGSIYSASTGAIYSDPQELLFYPITYNDTRSETFSGIVDWGSYMVDRTGTTDFDADAYGTLILPNETVNDVLRIKTVDKMSDSNNGVWSVSYEYNTYQWYHASRVGALLTWRTLKTITPSNNNVDTSGEWLKKVYIGVNEENNGIESVSIYPNPCTNEFYVELRDVKLEFVSMDLVDLTGRVMLHQQFNTKSGRLVEKVDITKLTAGLYTAVFKSEGILITKRIVVQ